MEQIVTYGNDMLYFQASTTVQEKKMFNEILFVKKKTAYKEQLLLFCELRMQTVSSLYSK